MQVLGELAAAINVQNNIRYQYVYALALNSAAQSAKALKVLREAQDKFADNVEILIALTTMNRDAGNNQEIKNLIRELSK